MVTLPPGVATGQFEMADIFTGNPFNVITLTIQVNNVPFTPSLLGSLGLYASDGVATTDIAVAERNGAIELIQTSERGSPPEQTEHPKRNMRKATVSHLAVEAQVNADEVQNAVSQGLLVGQPQLQSVQGLLDDRLEGPFGLRARMELTHEYHRLGGIEGIVLDKDGSELYNWYDFFGIVPLADHQTNFGTLDPEDGTFEAECRQLKRDMLHELEGLPITNCQPVVFCGDTYYDMAYSNKEVWSARKYGAMGHQEESDIFTKNKAFSSFQYGGITFVDYRGTKDGTVGIAADEARLFAYGVPGLFQMLFGPPDILGLTNMKGLPIFAYMPHERMTSRRVVVEAQSNPLTLCVRPRSLRRLTHA